MRRPKCTPNAQTDGGDRSLGMIYLPDKIDLNMARNTCSNLAQIDLTLGVCHVLTGHQFCAPIRRGIVKGLGGAHHYRLR